MRMSDMLNWDFVIFVHGRFVFNTRKYNRITLLNLSLPRFLTIYFHAIYLVSLCKNTLITTVMKIVGEEGCGVRFLFHLVLSLDDNHQRQEPDIKKGLELGK